MKIAICEDMAGDAQRLSECVKASGFETEIDMFKSGEELLKSFRRGVYHIVFLDIYMDGLSGMETAAALRGIDTGVPIAFATTSNEHALEANRYRSLLYMKKPVDALDVAHCLSIAKALMERRSNEVLSFTASDLNNYKIPYDEIVMIEAHNHRCIIHKFEGESIEAVTSVTIDYLEQKLPSPPFLRCHRAYIINMRHKTGEDGPDIVMAGDRKAYVRLRDERKMKTACDKYAIALTRGSET